MLPEQVGSKAVPSTMIVSCNAYEAIQRDQTRNRACRIEATIGKGVNLLSKDLVVFPCKPRYKVYSSTHYTLHLRWEYNVGLVERACGTGSL